MTQMTAKNWPINRAPKRIELLGDKTKRPESAQHIIEFPGGAIELSRTTDGNYWAHIIINRRDPHFTGATGEVVGSRIGRHGGGKAIESIADEGDLEQIAVLIRPVKFAD